MQGKPISPGAYVKEKNFSQRVEQVSNTILAIVAPCNRGPVMQRTPIFGDKHFLQLFGKPDPRLIRGGAYGALAIARTSGQLYFTRLVQTDPKKNRPLTAGAYCTVDDPEAAHPIVSLKPFDDGTMKPKGIYDPMNTIGFVPGTAAVENIPFFVCAENPGEWNNNLYVRIRTSLPAGVSEFDPTVDPTEFYLDVFENYRSPKQQPDESFKVCREYRVDGAGNQMHIEEVVNKRSVLIRVKNNELCRTDLPFYDAVDVYLDGGTNGDPVTVGRYIEGLDLYADPEDVDVNLLVQAGAPSHFSLYDIADVQHAMLNICENRMDCSAILDNPDSEEEPALAVAYRRGILNSPSSYGAMFAPYVEVKDKYNDLFVKLPPSIDVAVAAVKTDSSNALWFAAAGMVRGSLPSVRNARKYNQKARDIMHDAQINCLRYFSDGSGYKIWGADTLAVEKSALNYWPVRRLLCHVEKAISVAAQYNTFDPNDEILWAKLTEVCERFMKPIKNGRGVYWYEVTCNDTNNTPDTIASGDVMLDLYLDPAIFAKRIHLNAIIVKTGGIANFKEYAKEIGRGGE